MKSIKVTYGIEDLKYRVFGLFPFFGKDENGNMVLYQGNSSSDGCYNQLSCNLIIPCNLEVGNKVILEAGKSYSFRTLFNYYKQYISLQNNPFIKFMDKGVGRIKINIRIDREKCDLVPEFVNLSECQDIYNEMYKMWLLCTRYKDSLASGGQPINCDMECLIDKYERMGGDIMRDYYKQSYEKANDIAVEFKEKYADPQSTSYNISLCMTETIHDIGSADCYTDLWDAFTRYFKGDMVVYDGVTYICKGNETMVDGNLVDEGVIAEWDDVICRYTFDETKYTTIKEALSGQDYHDYVYNTLNGSIELNGLTNSKLKTFRKFGDYMSTLGQVETPGIGEDWLYYYKINSLAAYTTTRDEYNNISVFEPDNRVTIIGEYEPNMYAYGDILTDITPDTINNKIQFTYVIGAHLKARLVSFDVNEFNVPIFKYGDFEYDDSDRFHGVEYTESYYYAPDGEIDQLIKNGLFDDYITNDITGGTEFVKGEFDLTSVISNSITTINGTEVEFSYIPSTFRSYVDDDRETTIYPLIRPDYYDGIGYTPKVTNRVRFSRGNSAAFERHLKLGEVKSLDDFINYSNGGFFNIR